MNRAAIFGRLLAVATVLHEHVADGGMPPLYTKYLDKIQREPVKTLTRAHHDIMQLTHKFGAYEMVLLDMFGELMSSLVLSDYDDSPLSDDYLIAYYKQKQALHDVVGYKEVYDIMGWDYVKNRTILNTYWKVRKTFPAPIKILAGGPLWSRAVVEYYRDARK